ncbi:MAG: sugar phosphate isomerase/epimerase [Verrucomicrobia bacterium]|nr:sugar phosphate isomerase/epimerase [Verrucomicrobiota bacterium]
MSSTISERLAVCSWSLQPASPEQLLESLRATGVSRLQLALDPLRDDPRVWGALPALCAAQQVTVVSGMFGTIGEDYSTLDTIRRTGGLVPDETWEQNWKNFPGVVAAARQLGLSLVSFHAGFLPHEESDPSFAKLMGRVRQVAKLFGDAGIDLAFETGQETADTLRTFLQQLDCRNVGVNFDPANILLYDKGDPIEALRTLGPWLRQVHIKDAIRTRVSGTWGEEVVVGTGQVDWRAFFRALDTLGYRGNLCIEREAGSQRVADIRTAREFLGRLA